MNKLRITNGRIVSDGQCNEGELLIAGDRIEAIGASVPAQDATVFDARGCYVIPGMIDDQVHFREPA